MDEIKIGIIGDYDRNKPSHRATEEAIHHAAGYLSIEADITWLPTQSFLSDEGLNRLADFHCVFAAPGDTVSLEGAISGIKRTRLYGRPFLAT